MFKKESARSVKEDGDNRWPHKNKRSDKNLPVIQAGNYRKRSAKPKNYFDSRARSLAPDSKAEPGTSLLPKINQKSSPSLKSVNDH